MEQQTRSSAEYRDGEDEAQRNDTDIEDSSLSSDAINTLIQAKAALHADRIFHSFPSDTQVDQKNPVGPWNVSHYLSLQNQANAGGPGRAPQEAIAPKLDTFSTRTYLSSIAKETVQLHYCRFDGKEITKIKSDISLPGFKTSPTNKRKLLFSKYPILCQRLCFTHLTTRFAVQKN